MTKPPKTGHTLTAPTGSVPAAPAGPDAVVWLRAFGAGVQWDLSPLKQTFKLGASVSCDVVIDSPYVSQLHCTLERRGKRLLVTDAGSKNGLYIRERREQTFEIAAGDVFSVGTIPLLAMTEEMRVLRPTLEYLVSYGEPRRVDEALILGVRDEPVLILGEAKCGQQRVAELLHSMSPRRSRAFGELGDVHGAAEQNKRLKALTGGTVYIDLGLPAIRRGGVSAAVYSPSYDLRVIARADTSDHAVELLGAPDYARFAHIALSPVRLRRAELARMIDHGLVAARHPLGAADLGQANVDLLVAQDWPDNLEELEETLERIGVVVTAISDRKAAEVLGLAPSTLTRWLDRRGFRLPRKRR